MEETYRIAISYICSSYFKECLVYEDILVGTSNILYTYSKEEKPFTSSLNIYPEALMYKEEGAGGVIPYLPSHHHPIFLLIRMYIGYFISFYLMTDDLCILFYRV
jgi:hypothetical protein